MKLSKTMKKAIAYICAVAMVVGSLTIYKASSIKAADDYSDLDYTGTVANDGGINYDNLKGSTWALLENSTSIQEYSFNVFQYQEGNTLYVTAHTDVGLVGKINGIEGEKQGAGLFFRDVQNMLIYEYNILDITSSMGHVKVVIHCPGNSGKGTYEPGMEPETTEKQTDPSGHSWTEIGQGFSYEKGDGFSLVGIQQPAFATEQGIYISVSSGISQVIVNGKVQTDDKDNGIQGAGACVYLSYLTKKINTVQIVHAQGTATITIQNINGTDGEDPSTEPTTPGGESQETKELVPVEKQNSGQISAPERSEAGDNNQWAYQDTEYKLEGLTIQEGTWYKASCTVLSSIDRTIQMRFQNSANWTNYNEGFQHYSVKADEETQIVYIFQATSSAAGTGVFDICYGYIDGYGPVAASTIEFKNVSLTTYDSQEAAESAAGYLEVSNYQKDVPTSEGELFAGWYSDPGYTTPYTEKSGKAYAKFIDEKVLDVKAQVSEDNTSIRFVSTVDNLNYDGLGFKVEGYNGSKNATVDLKLNSVFSSLNANGESVELNTFSDQSSYFFAYAINGMSEGTTYTWKVTPYWTTEDGAVVTGTQKTFKVPGDGSPVSIQE